MNPLQQALNAAWQAYRRGDLQQAEECCLQALQIHPDQVEALHLLGVIAAQTGRLGRALDCFRAVLRLQPNLAGAHNDLGNVFAFQGKFVEAVACFREAVRLQPNCAGAQYNLGNALRQLGRLTEAVTSLQQAVRLEPKFAEAHQSLGLAWQALGKFAEAQASFREVVLLRPHDAEAHYHLGYALLQGAQAAASQEPAASFQEAIRLKPDFGEAYMGLGNVFLSQGQIDDAVAAFRTGLQSKSADPVVHSSLVMALQYHPGYDAGEIYAECRRWNQQHAEALRNHIQPHENVPDPERRLRIGYVSPDFRDHATSYCTIPLLAHHDHRQFEIFCYADVARPDAFTERLRGYADVWRDTAGLADDKVADLVRGDRIDILVDLSQHSAQHRLLVFARKPAPVQATWLGYVGTTGLATVDYRLTDPYVDPPGLFDACYAEESLRLPETYWCYDPLTEGPAVNPLPATACGALTFGCLNNFIKVNDDCLALWARVLLAVPGSRLLLLAPAGPAREHVADRLGRLGIATQRLQFTDRLPRPQYLELYHQIDVGLDPLPFNGHITSLDAHWMGVPVLTLVSKKTAVGRGGFSQLCNLGLAELAAVTPDQLVAWAIQLAGDFTRLAELRGTLRPRMERSPLMDGKRFARHVEQAYRRMWQRWCQERRQPRPA